MKRILLLFFFFMQVSVGICQKNNYWQQQVNYTIDVTLNDANNTLEGFERLNYFNHSPDTLYFIWFHVWPNAYKNDKTAFSEQLLENGRTDFYFSNEDKRGYINRLNFKVNGTTVKIEDHPAFQDIIKIILPAPLAPGASCKIETPFHVQLPYNFSRGGHVGQSYQITQWYPKPAVYDRKGWHPIPYLDQGEFYSEFGNYEVKMHVPQDYIVAATGELQKDETEKTSSPDGLKTMTYIQNDIHDFAWFADKTFTVLHDTIQLPSGKKVNAYAYFSPGSLATWKNSLAFIKNTILSRSAWLGEYPYSTVSVVEAKMGFSGGMEYPTITSISLVEDESELESTIEHEVGHNWNYGILASNERTHPWMDEGMNVYFDNRYKAITLTKADTEKKMKPFLAKRFPEDPSSLILYTLIKNRIDQPIETPSESFSETNYNMVAYTKTGEWMGMLEHELGKEIFDSCLHEFYTRWKFKHPYPEDFKKVIEDLSGKDVTGLFALLNKKGYVITPKKKTGFEIKSFFDLKNKNNKHQIYIAPAIGYNLYDKIMFGGLVHNFTLPQNRFQFLISPLYATNSKQLNGIGLLNYTCFVKNNGSKVEFGVTGSSFSDDSFTDTDKQHTEYFRFTKIVPSVKFSFANRNPRSRLKKFVQWKTFLIDQTSLLFTRDTVNDVDVITYPTRSSYINQLRFVVKNDRVLYPYSGEFVTDQGKDFIRSSITANYFFNYAKEGGMNVRFFAGKFFYLGDNTYLKQFNTDPYQLNMSGPKGYEDYTYSNYFIGRNEFEKYSSQQIMIRDGGFKVRTDMLSSKIGKTDKWLTAVNFTSSIPASVNPLQMLPVKIPAKIFKAFLDVGTYADAWGKNATTGKFIYDAGLQLSLLKNTVNIYVPLFYSKVYSDYFKSTITEKRFWKNISFSIDIQNFNPDKFVSQTLF